MPFHGILTKTAPQYKDIGNTTVQNRTKKRDETEKKNMASRVWSQYSKDNKKISGTGGAAACLSRISRFRSKKKQRPFSVSSRDKPRAGFASRREPHLTAAGREKGQRKPSLVPLDEILRYILHAGNFARRTSRRLPETGIGSNDYPLRINPLKKGAGE